MLAKVSGTVMELKQEFDEKKNELATVTAMIFQKGEKNLLSVKKVPGGMVVEGETVTEIPVRVVSYYFNGQNGLSCSYIGA